MKRIFVQAAKEWAEFRRDRLSLALAFLLPLATLLLFGYGVRLQAANIPIIVQDLDNSPISRALVARLFATDVLQHGSWEGKSSPVAAITAGGAKAAFVIPPHFGSDVEHGKPVGFQSLVDGSDVNSAQVIRAVTRGTNAFFLTLMQRPDLHAFYVLPQIRIWFNPGQKESLFIVPGVFGIILWMYPALLASVAASREVEQGTVVQVYASSLNAIEVLLGKALVYFAVGMCEALATVVVSALLFGLRFAGDPTPFLFCTAIYVLGSVFFGLFAGCATGSQTVAVQATATGGFFPSLLLSGFVYPIANIPFPLDWVCYFVPARYYIEVCRDAFVRGTGWTQMWYEPLVLLAFAGVLFWGAWHQIRLMQVKD